MLVRRAASGIKENSAELNGSHHVGSLNCAMLRRLPVLRRPKVSERLFNKRHSICNTRICHRSLETRPAGHKRLRNQLDNHTMADCPSNGGERTWRVLYRSSLHPLVGQTSFFTRRSVVMLTRKIVVSKRALDFHVHYCSQSPSDNRTRCI
jgi:hypothetical protein